MHGALFLDAYAAIVLPADFCFARWDNDSNGSPTYRLPPSWRSSRCAGSTRPLARGAARLVPASTEADGCRRRRRRPRGQGIRGPSGHGLRGPHVRMRGPRPSTRSPASRKFPRGCQGKPRTRSRNRHCAWAAAGNLTGTHSGTRPRSAPRRQNAPGGYPQNRARHWPRSRIGPFPRSKSVIILLHFATFVGPGAHLAMARFHRSRDHFRNHYTITEARRRRAPDRSKQKHE